MNSAARTTTRVIYCLAAIPTVGVIILVLCWWLIDYWPVWPIARFHPAPDCEVRIWNSTDSEPMAAHYCFEFLRDGHVVVPMTGFLWSNDTESAFRLVTAQDCTVFAVSRDPKTNHILVLLDAKTDAAQPSSELLQKLQRRLPHRALIAPEP